MLTGERLEEKECDQVLKDCLDPEDDEGFVPYVRKYQFTNDKLHRSTLFKRTNDFRPATSFIYVKKFVVKGCSKM